MIDLEKLERKILDDYCIEGGLRPSIEVMSDDDVELKLSINFIRYTKSCNKISSGEVEIEYYIWMNIDVSTNEITGIGTNANDRGLLDEDDYYIDDRYCVLVYHVYERMMDDVETGIFTID